MDNRQTSIIDRDPVTFEVVRSALYFICAEMKSVINGESLQQAYSRLGQETETGALGGAVGTKAATGRAGFR